MTYSQQPPTYPQPEPQYTQPAPPPAGRNVLALVALIVSIVGFIFACIPGALIVGWILLPIAFILALVSLFLKGTGKSLGIAGLIISVVGTIVGVVVFFAVVAVSFNDAFNTDTTIMEQPAAETSAGQAPIEQAAPASGTRENPIAVGSTITSGDWTVVVNSFNPDGSAIVAEANSFNEAAPAGAHYALVNYTVTYTGANSAYAAEVGVDLVTAGGNVINSFDTPVVLTDNFGLDELFTGASASGSAAFLVPDGQEALIRVRPGIIADEVFVKP